MPSSANWKMLDDILQIPPYLGLERITVSGFPIYPGSPHALLSGNLHAYRERDAVADQQAIAKLLPITHNRRALHHWDHPDGTPTRSPARVDAFMPTEVCERIIDLVANAPGEYYVGIVWPEDVQATLAACSLTCRAWRARAQAYLFRALILAGDEAALGRFRRLLTRNPMLSPFVRTCTLYSAPSSPSSALHIAPLSLSPMLPDVESLRILNGTLHIPPRAPFGPCMRRLSSVVQLMLIQVTLPSLADLRRVVCACRQVKELVIMGCEWPHTPATRTSHSARSTCGRSGPRTQVRLTKIALDFPTECAGDPRVVRFLQWLAGSGVMSSAEHISVYPMAVASTELLKAVGAFVCAASRTLEGLYVSMTPTVDFSSLTEAIVQCSKLRWLEFIVPLESTIFAQLAVLLSAGLSQAQAQRELCLRLTLIHPGGAVAEATDEEWRQLDEALEAVGPKILSDVVIYRRFLAGPSTCTDSLDWRLHEDCDDDRLYQRLGDLLPQTCKSKRLWARPASPESGAIYSRIEGSCSRI
ncbi:hypothetical protein PsYK624_086880 [Phanerochaete sordida]|uniref:F-box domain-containing protein n=1 Tax=Phanerochaete sordida TaxID=48140 RepID=A0A9P3GDU9_9APHY|nr:hypothetical protein PsYK624_086880 [Phanerochaete sordida]